MTSRRQMLKSSLALAAGAVGIGAARTAMKGGDPPAEAATRTVRSGNSLSLTARDVHVLGDGRPVGHGPQAGDRTVLSGELVDAGGRPLGRFLGTATTFDGASPGDSAVESHTFQLPDGTLHGMGTVERGGESVFAIVGGTGRYLGARGSYVATRMPIELGGDGTAAFTMTFAR
ncbi:MAG TPA: hypothetical protein VID47_10580 [Actinomycetota bacterium]|jgi:hypothetical protein